ncbi:alcohol dehydrogenase catalytic domain-containing protein [Jatrophihabitans sp. YIM 134969]
MRAAWFDRRGPAGEVLVVGELPDPHPGPGEVRIAVEVSGLSPGDVKKRGVWQGNDAMAFPRVIPHSDGAGVIDAVGAGVSPARLGTRVWCHGAQSYRPFGTAAQYVVVPDTLAVDLPSSSAHDDHWLADQAACLGIAGITGYRAVFADGPVDGLQVVVHGAVGGVGAFATQMARRGGAEVIAVVRDGQEDRAHALGAAHVFTADRPDLGDAIRAVAPAGVHRIADVDFGAHVDLNAGIVATGATISAYATSVERPQIPYWTLGFADTCVRFLGSDDFSPAVKAAAAAELTAALVAGDLRSTIAARVPLDRIAEAHEMVEAGAAGRVLVDIG